MGNTRRPSAGLQSVGKAGTDCLDSSLESAKIIARPQPDDTSTSRAMVASEKHGIIETIKIRLYKTMTPHGTCLATGAQVRLGPWIITTLFENLLDLCNNKE